MSASDYVLDNLNECNRLERQAALESLERHLRHFPSSSGLKILDAGCGSGAMARKIASSQPGSAVVGVDLNPSYVAFARKHVGAQTLGNLSFEVGDLMALPFPDRSFDVVWSRFVLYFLPRPETAVAEFRRILRPGGALIVSLHNWSTLINYPEDVGLRERQQKVFARIADMRLAQKIPAMLLAGGFNGVSVEIELDPVYSALGVFGPNNRRNFAEVLASVGGRIEEVLGGRAEAEAYVADQLAYLDRPDTYTYSLLWTVKANAPAASAPADCGLRTWESARDEG